MDSLFIAVVCLVALALLFDFLNGFHDAANSIATIVSTRVLSPKHAVMWAASFNFIAFVVFSHAVAKTVGKGIVDINIVDTYIIFGALVGACSWNLLTWYFGLPSSSSHALMGGLVGAAIVKGGTGVLIGAGIRKTLIFIVVSPVLGLVLALLMGVIVYRMFQHSAPAKVDHWFRKGQLLSAAAYSLGHGGNDAQKTMGIIVGLLVSVNYLPQTEEFKIPLWVVLSCQGAIALGTMGGGWRIVKTLGHKISKLRPIDGFCAESAAAATLFMSSALGIPVSTTHTITGAIMGIGTLKRFNAVKWGVAGQIVWAWVLTIPGSALVSAAAYWLAVRMF